MCLFNLHGSVAISRQPCCWLYYKRSEIQRVREEKRKDKCEKREVMVRLEQFEELRFDLRSPSGIGTSEDESRSKGSSQ